MGLASALLFRISQYGSSASDQLRHSGGIRTAPRIMFQTCDLFKAMPWTFWSVRACHSDSAPSTAAAAALSHRVQYSQVTLHTGLVPAACTCSHGTQTVVLGDVEHPAGTSRRSCLCAFAAGYYCVCVVVCSRSSVSSDGPSLIGCLQDLLAQDRACTSHQRLLTKYAHCLT